VGSDGETFDGVAVNAGTNPISPKRYFKSPTGASMSRPGRIAEVWAKHPPSFTVLGERSPLHVERGQGGESRPDPDAGRVRHPEAIGGAR